MFGWAIHEYKESTPVIKSDKHSSIPFLDGSKWKKRLKFSTKHEKDECYHQQWNLPSSLLSIKISTSSESLSFKHYLTISFTSVKGWTKVFSSCMKYKTCRQKSRAVFYKLVCIAMMAVVWSAEKILFSVTVCFDFYAIVSGTIFSRQR